jgi:uncharacterized LabA/DUF88 family protein
MGRSAVFVDAGYFWVQVSQAVLGRIGTRSEISVDYPGLRTNLLDEVKKKTSNSELLRVYWYDGPNSSGKGPDHESIEILDDFKLRLGTRNQAGQQKAVDGLIIADMLNLTQSRAIDCAVLVSGDADLTPGVTAAQAMGLRLHLMVLEPRKATSPYLAAEADSKLYLDADWAKGFATTTVFGATGTVPVPNAADPPQVVQSTVSAVAPPLLDLNEIAAGSQNNSRWF